MKEYTNLLILSGITILLIVLLEFLARKEVISKIVARKTLHITTGFVVILATFLINSFGIMVFIGLVFSLLNYILIKRKILKQIDGNLTTHLGIFYYPLAFLIIVLIFWNVNKYILAFSFFIFSISDAAAGLVGTGAKIKRYLKIHGEPKTFNGLFATIISSLLVLIFLRYTFYDYLNFIKYDFLSFLFLALMTSIIAGIVEALSSKGTDNLYLPVVLAFIGFIFFHKGIDLPNFLLASFLAFLISLISLKYKLLSLSGSFVTFILALFIFGLGSWTWTIPILTFFILSSVLSKFSEFYRSKELNDVFNKGSKRDMFQVLANGGVPLMISLLNYLFPDLTNWYFIYILSIAIAMADTWSTEIGTLFAKNIFLITNFARVEAGISGGISLVGTLGGLLGSITITFCAMLFHQFLISDLIIINIFATLGNLFDSFLGATLQVTYRCKKCWKMTEKLIHCDSSTEYYKGLTFINNDFVNFSSVLLLSKIYFLFLIL